MCGWAEMQVCTDGRLPEEKAYAMATASHAHTHCPAVVSVPCPGSGSQGADPPSYNPCRVSPPKPFQPDLSQGMGVWLIGN